jgi:hypothetical protein
MGTHHVNEDALRAGTHVIPQDVCPGQDKVQRNSFRRIDRRRHLVYWPHLACQVGCRQTTFGDIWAIVWRCWDAKWLESSRGFNLAAREPTDEVVHSQRHVRNTNVKASFDHTGSNRTGDRGPVDRRACDADPRSACELTHPHLHPRRCGYGWAKPVEPIRGRTR